MKKPARFVTVLAGAIVACMVMASASFAAPPRSAGKAATPKVETYSVVQIGDEAKVVKKSELASLRKTAAEDYKRAVKDYNTAKKEAAKSKDKDKDKSAPEKPVKRKIVDLAKKTFKTEQEAGTWLDNYLQEPKKDDSKSKTDKKAAAK